MKIKDIEIDGDLDMLWALKIYLISSDSTYGLEAMCQLFKEDPGAFSLACSDLMNLGETEASVRNMRELVTRIIPFAKEHNLKANPFNIKDAIAAFHGRSTPQRHKERLELLALLKDPAATQKQVRAIRAKYKSR